MTDFVKMEKLRDKIRMIENIIDQLRRLKEEFEHELRREEYGEQTVSF